MIPLYEINTKRIWSLSQREGREERVGEGGEGEKGREGSI